MAAIPLEQLASPTLPLRKSKIGYFQMSSGLDVINNSIRDIVGTQKGERVMRPNYGCDIHLLPFEPADAATQALFRRHILDAIQDNEPRVAVRSGDITVAFNEDDDGNMVLSGTVTWRFKHSQTGESFGTDFSVVLGG